ncbi:MAG: molybdopterin-dependent oxidoreductase [Anaerolineales bacterium]
MDQKDILNRREFLKASTITGLGLVISIYLPGCKSKNKPDTQIPQEDTPEIWMEPSAYLKIDNHGQVTVTVHRTEMGQGIRTALPMLIAEELDVPWESIRVEQAPGDKKFGNQTTGGSVSISSNFLSFRRAGAAARLILVRAAAEEWGVDETSIRTEFGSAIHPSSGNQIMYGELVEAASKMDIPSLHQVSLKESQDFNIIGTSVGRVDNPEIVRGQVEYASDVQLPDMLYAIVVRCPIIGGRVDSYNSREAEAVPGVRDVVEIDEGVAIIAENTWAAIKGSRVLSVTWNEGTNPNRSTEDIRRDLLEKAGEPETSENILDVIYEIPYLPHLPMEPMNCVADVRPDHCEVWAPTQSPQDAKYRIRSITKLNDADIIVHVPLLGGGFGRRLDVDYVEEAVKISKEVSAPIKLFWSRSDDIRYDHFHPLSVHRVVMDLDKPVLPRSQFSRDGTGIPTGSWRSVSNMPQAFVRETAIDEMAAALERDPYELRLELEEPVFQEVLQMAATKAGWGEPLPNGWGRGIACFSTFDVTPVAMVAEVSVDENKNIQIRRVVCAVDCGFVVNPNMVEAQMEGGIVFGITAALKNPISIDKGRIEQSNFHQCQLLQFEEMPEIEVYIIDSNRSPSGIGEMAVPPIIPTIGNAIYDATGIRLRRIPFKPEDLM